MALPRRNRRSRTGPTVTQRMLFWGGIGLFTAYLSFFLIFGRMGLIAHLRLDDEANRIDSEIVQVNKEIEALSEQTEALSRDPHTIERIAREKLGMVHPEETIYLFDAGGAGAPAERGQRP